MTDLGIVLIEVVNIFVKNLYKQRHMRRAGLNANVCYLEALLQALQDPPTVSILHLRQHTPKRSQHTQMYRVSKSNKCFCGSTSPSEAAQPKRSQESLVKSQVRQSEVRQVKSCFLLTAFQYRCEQDRTALHWSGFLSSLAPCCVIFEAIDS